MTSSSTTYQHDYVRSLQYHHAYDLTNCHLASHEEHHEVVPEDSKNRPQLVSKSVKSKHIHDNTKMQRS